MLRLISKAADAVERAQFDATALEIAKMSHLFHLPRVVPANAGTQYRSAKVTVFALSRD